MSDEVKKPEAGEYWEYKEERFHCVGATGIHAAVARKDGAIIVFRIEHVATQWKHIPDCDSFEWQSETFPQYWTLLRNTPDDYAFVKVISKKQAAVFKKDGTQSGGIFCWSKSCEEGRTQLTKEQAEALRTPICSMCGLSLAIPGTAGCRDCTEFAIDQVRAPVEPPTNQQLFEMIANLRDRMDAINKRLQIVECEVPL